MNSNTILFSFVLLFTSLYAKTQTQIFKDYNFNEGGYSIVGTYLESDENFLQDSLGEFYTDDIAILNQFKNTWVFNKPSPKYACGYHYSISLCKNGESIQSFAINLNCNEIVTDDAYFFFPDKLLRQFYGKLTQVYTKQYTFETITEARNKRIELLHDSLILKVSYNNWVDFEGEFDFTFTCPDDCRKLYSNLDSLIIDSISNMYKNEPFHMYTSGSSLTSRNYTLQCNKSLEEKFDLYPKVTSEYGKWKPFRYEFTIYYKRGFKDYRYTYYYERNLYFKAEHQLSEKCSEILEYYKNDTILISEFKKEQAIWDQQSEELFDAYKINHPYENTKEYDYAYFTKLFAYRKDIILKRIFELEKKY